MQESSFDRKKAVATADIFELLSAAFSFPSEELAQALIDSTFYDDLSACLAELDWEGDQIKRTEETLPENLQGEMWKEYSRLYHTPGKWAVIYPYESAFLFKLKGLEGLPVLIANPTTQDVEKHMRDAGFLPKDFRREPSDGIEKEFEFLRILYTLAAQALTKGRVEEAKRSLERAATFRQEHLNVWSYDFLRLTLEETRLEIYRSLASAALIALDATAVKSSR